jgi:hypothetical protein
LKEQDAAGCPSFGCWLRFTQNCVATEGIYPTHGRTSSTVRRVALGRGPNSASLCGYSRMQLQSREGEARTRARARGHQDNT